MSAWTLFAVYYVVGLAVLIPAARTGRTTAPLAEDHGEAAYGLVVAGLAFVWPLVVVVALVGRLVVGKRS